MVVVTAVEPFSQEEAMDVSNSDFLSQPFILSCPLEVTTHLESDSALSAHPLWERPHRCTKLCLLSDYKSWQVDNRDQQLIVGRAII